MSRKNYRGRSSPGTLAFWVCETPRRYSRLLLGLQFPSPVQAGTRFYTCVEWGEQWWGLGPTSIPSELGHLAMPINFLAQGKSRWHKRVSNPGPLDPESHALPLRHTGWADGSHELQKIPYQTRQFFFSLAFFRSDRPNWHLINCECGIVRFQSIPSISGLSNYWSSRNCEPIPTTVVLP